MMIELITFLLIAVLGFVLNLIYALYVRTLAEGKTLMAAIFSETVVFVGAVSTINYVENHLLIIPLIIGGFFGTLSSDKVLAYIKKDKNASKNTQS